MESIWICSKPIKWILITLISHAFQSRFLQFSNLLTYVSVPRFNVKTSFVALFMPWTGQIYSFLSLTRLAFLLLTCNLPNWIIIWQFSHSISTNASVTLNILPPRYPTYISQPQVMDPSCYTKMNVAQMTVAFQVVQILVYHPVFTPSICGVHQYHTTSCRGSCRVLKDWKGVRALGLC